MLILIAGLAIPHAFGANATLFAATYAVVRIMHLALYADASRRGNASWAAILGFAVTVLIGMALLLAGSFLEGWHRDLLWTVAVAIDYAGPALLTRERLRGLQEVAVAHFAERYALFVLICLGESIVAIGVGASGRRLDFSLVAAVALGAVITIGLWWVYFARTASAAEERLCGRRQARDSRRERTAARRGAAGVVRGRRAVPARARRLPLAPRARGERRGDSHGAAVLVLYFAGAAMPAWALASVVAALLTGLCLLEAALERRGTAAAAAEIS